MVDLSALSRRDERALRAEQTMGALLRLADRIEGKWRYRRSPLARQAVRDHVAEQRLFSELRVIAMVRKDRM